MMESLRGRQCLRTVPCLRGLRSPDSTGSHPNTEVKRASLQTEVRSEDEAAVQEAERLIEETHNTLRRMEADLQVKRTSGIHTTGKSEKLKTAVNTKIKSLERELKSLSMPMETITSKNCNPSHLQPKSTGISFKVSDGTPANATAFSSKANTSFGVSHLPPVLPSTQKSSKPRKDMNAAEVVVLSAREKVADALAVARNVSASLGQHVCASTPSSKPLANYQATNIGVYEVRSRADEKVLAPKLRLELASLPSISINRGLERQSIPVVQVLPGEKVIPTNVSVLNIKHTEGTVTHKKFNRFEEKEELVSKETVVKERTESLQEHHSSTAWPSDIKMEGAIAQLSKQLAEVEELREINQAQVNHVLRFLLARVCNSPQSVERSDKPETNHLASSKADKSSKQLSPTSISSSSSDNSQYPIAYDSLSRFLETYKKAAEQNMLARKRAAMRRQKVTVKQKREIEQVQKTSQNHLLIGPLRRVTRLSETDQGLAQKEQPPTASQSSRSQSPQPADRGKGLDSFTIHINDIYAEFNDKEDVNLEFHVENTGSSSHDLSNVLSSLKPLKEISGDEYEDDWEEEENPHGDKNEDEQFSDPSVQQVMDVNERLPSNFQRQESLLTGRSSSPPVGPVGPVEVKTVPPNNRTIDEPKPHPEDEGPHHAISLLSLEVDPVARVNRRDNTMDGESPQSEKIVKDEVSTRVLSIDNSADDFVPSHNNQIAQDSLAVCRSFDSQKATNHQRVIGTKKRQINHRKRQAKCLNSTCSSSDDESTHAGRPLSHSTKLWDLKLREDIQLQSAILLNWQLEDRKKNRNGENDCVKDHFTLQSQQKEALDGVEKRWQQSLDQLDQRLKSIEDTDRIHRIVNEIRMQSKEECSKTCVRTPLQDVAKEKNDHANSQTVQNENNVRMRMIDQMVQTSPIKYDSSLLNQELDQQSIKIREPTFSYKFEGVAGVPRDHKPNTAHLHEDLTSELLAYSRMGILTKPQPEQWKPLSSSTESSNVLSSSAVVSMSDGEMRHSASGSCSCSEGELCVCGRQKLCSQRAPPDGSQTLSDGENFSKDMSHGEIPFNQFHGSLKDTSHGEIAVLSEGLGDESFESDGS